MHDVTVTSLKTPTTTTVSVGSEDRRARRGPLALLRAAEATVVDTLWNHRTLVGNFTRRELKAKYKGSILGSVWSLLNPLATLGIYTLIFGFFLKFPPETAGNGHLRNFAVYLFTALTSWNLFFGLVSGTLGSLIAAGGLLRKVYFPPSAPVFGSAFATLYQTVIEMSLLAIAFIALRNVSWTFLLVPVLVFFLFMFALGIGLGLSVINARYRDVAYLVTITLSLLFYCEPIIYPQKYVDQKIHFHPWLHIYYWNPLTQFIDAFRDCFYRLRVPNATTFLSLAIWSFGLLAIGWWVFERGARKVAEEL